MAWAPGEGGNRRKDYSRANERAKRLRRELTPSEKKLWKILRELKHEGAHFRKQCQVGHFVYDFAALSHRLLIELDGGAHDWADVEEQDRIKTEAAERHGFRVLRLRNEELNYTEHVIERVRAHLLPPAPGPSPKGEG